MEFDSRVVFEDLSCRFARGRVCVLLGGSGSGKSTLLRMIAGLVQPSAGRLLVGEVDMIGASRSQLAAARERIGMLFQGGALLDSLTIFDNIALPLREHTDLGPDEIAGRVHERLAAVGLVDVDDLLPGQLSGGMLRRAALARAIVREPDLLLCDEPFSGLDPASVKRIEALLARLNRELGITILIVSHHIPSTLRLADEAMLLLPGRVIAGAPEDLRSSADAEVADFFDEETAADDVGPAITEAPEP
jgi:phospholipid/cholesterol/gamma-HCH transport system ATP-binding protein